jgi:hypothetical protein
VICINYPETDVDLCNDFFREFNGSNCRLCPGDGYLEQKNGDAALERRWLGYSHRLGKGNGEGQAIDRRNEIVCL